MAGTFGRCESFEVEMSARGSVTPPSPAEKVPNGSLVSPMESHLPPACESRKRRSTFRGGVVSPTADRWNRTRDGRQEFDMALQGNQLKGVNTSAANEVLNHTTNDVHRRAGALISPRRAVLRALVRIIAQPYFLLFAICIGALICSAVLDFNKLESKPLPRDAHSHTTWLIVEAAVVTAVLILHTTLDVTLYTRRTTDVYNKFTALLRNRRCVISGNSEGLTGLRDADSCRMMSVLRSAGAPSSSNLLATEFISTMWSPHEILRNAVRTTCKLEKPPPSIGPSSTDVFFGVEVWCSSASFVPIAFSCISCTKSTTITLHSQVSPPEGGWKEATWQRLDLRSEIECAGQPTDTLKLVIVAAPYQLESTETIKIRNVSISHRSWRWRSVPEAMTVAEQDIAMDIGKMRIFCVAEEILMKCIVSIFSAAPNKELPDPESPKVLFEKPAQLGSIVKSPDHGSPGSCTPTSIKDDQVSPFLSPTDPQRGLHHRIESEAELASCHSGSVDGKGEDPDSTSDEEEDPTTTEDLEAMTTGTARPTSSQRLMFLVQRFMAYLSIVLLVLVAIANAAWIMFGHVGHLSWYYRFIQGPVCIVLALIPVGTTFVLRIIDCYANACLRSMMEMQDKTLQVVSNDTDNAKKPEHDTMCASSYTSTSYSSQDTESDGGVAGGDIFAALDEGQLMLGKYNSNLSGRQPPPSREEAGLHLDTLSHPSITRQMILKHMWTMLTNTASQAVPNKWWSATYDLVHSRNACQILGSMTVLACLDKAGILSEVVPVPEKVLVMKRKDEGWDDGRGAEEYQAMAFNILGLHNNDSAENLLQFADPDWRKHYPQLKPLGLTAALHCMQHLEQEVSDVAPQRHARSSKHGRRKRNKHTSSHIREQLHFDDTILWGKYLYFLGKEIGFSVQLLHALGFKVMKRIHTLRPIETFKKKGKDKHIDPKASSTYDEKTANYDPTLDGRQQMASLVVVDSNGKWQLLSIGHPQFILEYTSDYWNGEEVLPLGTTDKKELLYTSNEWRRQRDLVTVAFAYRPLSSHLKDYVTNDKSGVAIHILETEKEKHTNEDFDASSDEDSADEAALSGKSAEVIYQRLQKKQIFLGMVGSRAPPKNMVQDLIAEFQNAGIRFIHFNNGNERMTKAFGEKLGLWTTANDWNCCISLKRDAKVHKSAVKARLPAGIKRIREHIVSTDNVPLLVPLFCDSQPVAVRQMIRILQENNEVVGCVGSSINHTNTPPFLQADFGISTMPTCNSRFIHQNHAFAGSRTMYGLPGCPIGNVNKERFDSFTNTLKGLFNLGSLISLPCAITLTPSEYPLYFILCLVKQARLQLHCMLKIAEVLVSWSVCWSVCCFCCSVALLPPIIRVIDLCWQLYVLLPILSLALYEPFESLMCKKVMKIHPNKNNKREQWNVFKHLVKLWLTRYVLTCVVMVGVYVVTLVYSSGESVLHLIPPSKGMLEDDAFLNAVQYSQQTAMCVAVMLFSMHSVGALSRHLRLKIFEFSDDEIGKKRFRFALFRRKLGSEYYNPLEFSSFYLTNLGVWVLQAGYSIMSLYLWPPGGSASYKHKGYPYYLYPAVVVYMIIVVVLDNKLKMKRKKNYINKQTWRKLDFDTRLGMHSPRGDDEGDEDKGALKEAKKNSRTYWDMNEFFSI